VCDRVAILRQGRLVHLEELGGSRQGRLVRARCAGPLEPLPSLEGLRVLEQTPERIALEATGHLPELLQWLARQPLSALRIGPPGLTAIYTRYHGAER